MSALWSDRISVLKRFGESKPHGTRSRYNAGCRCDECRESNRVYERKRTKRKIFHGPALVSATPVRSHIRELSAAGVGRHSVAELAGVNDRRVQEIANGKRLHVKASTAARILAVTASMAKSRAYIPAGPTKERIAHLIAEHGYTRAQIASWLGYATPALQIAKGCRVTKRNADRIAALAQLARSGRIMRCDDGRLREIKGSL